MCGSVIPVSQDETVVLLFPLRGQQVPRQILPIFLENTKIQRDGSLFKGPTQWKERTDSCKPSSDLHKCAMVYIGPHTYTTYRNEKYFLNF